MLCIPRLEGLEFDSGIFSEDVPQQERIIDGLFAARKLRNLGVGNLRVKPTSGPSYDMTLVADAIVNMTGLHELKLRMSDGGVWSHRQPRARQIYLTFNGHCTRRDSNWGWFCSERATELGLVVDGHLNHNTFPNDEDDDDIRRPHSIERRLIFDMTEDKVKHDDFIVGMQNLAYSFNRVHFKFILGTKPYVLMDIFNSISRCIFYLSGDHNTVFDISVLSFRGESWECNSLAWLLSMCMQMVLYGDTELQKNDRWNFKVKWSHIIIRVPSDTASLLKNAMLAVPHSQFTWREMFHRNIVTVEEYTDDRESGYECE